MKQFHLHIYFGAGEVEQARILSDRASASRLFQFLSFHERPVGPHPTGMIEVHFSAFALAAVTRWVEENRGDFSAFLHQDTGDDIRDHTDGFRWFGPALTLDFSFFELIRHRPELRVHPA